MVRKSNLVYWILIVVLLVLALFAGSKLVSALQKYADADAANGSLVSEFVSLAREPLVIYRDPSRTVNGVDIVEAGEAAAPGVESFEWYTETSPLDIDFDGLLAKSKDVVAWLYCEDTAVNNVVAQGATNQTYLRSLLDGSYSVSGTLFTDAACERDFSGKNMIIYGHNMKNMTFFGCLPKFANQSYFDEHSIWWVNTPTQNYKIELFAAYTTSAGSETYRTAFASDEAFMEYIEDARSRSDVESDVEVGPEDRIVTLSTCSYDFDGARYVLQGKLTKVG